ncbi:L-serine ammonia-lyase [Solimicrobium silvestre]|uniref:L-serine dehydratase n=1 Tax=Solimicrobium silvestre TaxID=2099400 RepID=A0A2S9GW76_9BURK|nr:L-serine ammonia-lyase [Solimicrobium silvestre]PRC91972.1 L-serine ammonia-lyase [Solimicrobium silvestre]
MPFSVFEVFRIGIGPSSSHTVGPMLAVNRFLQLLKPQLTEVARVQVDLYGSLALTGVGHGTNGAVILGLLGEQPHSVNPATAQDKVDLVRLDQQLLLDGTHEISFSCATDLLFHMRESLPQHPNGMRLTAFDADGNVLVKRAYFSIGGGAVQDEDEIDVSVKLEVTRSSEPCPFASAQDLLNWCETKQCSIADIVLDNELTYQDEQTTRLRLLEIWQVMHDCVERGLITEGTLPGGLSLKRRAPAMFRQAGHGSDGKLSIDFALMDILSAFAIAVNEENAAGGRVVTAPTNGSAGVIPAVLSYYTRFNPSANDDGIIRFLLTAAGIGMLYKRNASISAAEMGCQGEIGVSASMAAAGLVAVMGGTNLQVENAAEIAMEHFLGMTCDPLNGLVQVPCIERNSMGAIKAINAARMAMMSDGRHLVSLDQVIETMRQTGIDMQSKYKETSLGGLAVNVVFC